MWCVCVCVCVCVRVRACVWYMLWWAELRKMDEPVKNHMLLNTLLLSSGFHTLTRAHTHTYTLRHTHAHTLTRAHTHTHTHTHKTNYRTHESIAWQPKI